MLRLLAAAFLYSLAIAGAAAANRCEAEILRASARYGVPTGILYAVGLAETGVKGSLQPYALNIEGKAAFPRSRDQALEMIEAARDRGKRLIDVGCMQINAYYHAENFAGLREMLDPHHNVDYAARFLLKLKSRNDTWTMAVARYHAGPNNNPAQKQYVCRIVANLAATGFGKWTPQARSFCSS